VVLSVHISVFVDSLLKQTEQKTPVLLLLLAHLACLPGGLYVLVAEIASYLIGGPLSRDLPNRFSRFFHEIVRI